MQPEKPTRPTVSWRRSFPLSSNNSKSFSVDSRSRPTGTPSQTYKKLSSWGAIKQLDMGLGDLEVFHQPVLDRIIAEIKRMHGEPEKRERLPITRDFLIKLLRKLDTTNEVQATLHAAYSIAFAAFLRAGEFTYKQGDMQDPSFDSWN